MFKGSEHDVLNRYYSAAYSLGLNENDIVVRITGDCPLIDPRICDGVVLLLMHSNADYSSNVVSCTFPDGLDCEVMRFGTLEKAWRQSKLKYEREHIILSNLILRCKKPGL